MVRTSVRILISSAVAVLFVASGVPAGAGDSSSGDREGCDDRQTYAAPFAQGRCLGVRPGAIVRSNSGMCTFAFLFRGSDRRNYMTTAGHCIIPKGGEKKWSGDRAPTAFNAYGQAIGKWIYANFRWPEIGVTYDIALIRLNPGVKASPKMCHFGGPDGMYAKRESVPSVLRYFGNSPTWKDALPARSAVAPNTSEKNYVLAVAESAPGDSGSGVINQRGEAVGILTGGYVAHEFPVTVFSRLDYGIARAQKVLKMKFSIKSAAVSPDTSL